MESVIHLTHLLSTVIAFNHIKSYVFRCFDTYFPRESQVVLNIFDVILINILAVALSWKNTVKWELEPECHSVLIPLWLPPVCPDI
jgi:hypothetical protein